MITDAILALLSGIVNFCFGLLPDWSFDLAELRTAGGESSYSTWDNRGEHFTTGSPLIVLMRFLGRFNDFLPVDQMILIASTAAAFYLALFIFRAAKYVIGVVRGAGTG